MEKKKNSDTIKNEYIDTDILMSELHSDSTWACPDYCIYDSGHNCGVCERFEHTLFQKNKDEF